MTADALSGLSGDLTGRYYRLSDMTDQEQQQLIDVRGYITRRGFYRENKVAWGVANSFSASCHLLTSDRMFNCIIRGFVGV